MTLTDPTSVWCALRQHTRCDGAAHDPHSTKPEPCSCTCHTDRRKR